MTPIASQSRVLSHDHMNTDPNGNEAGGHALGWPRVRLGDLVTISHGWPFKSDSFANEQQGRPIVVAIGNFEYTGGFRFETTSVKEYIGDYPKEYELVPGDILLVMTCQTAGGEILGVPGQIPDDGKTYLHNQRLGKVVIREPGKIHSDFIYHLARCPAFNRALCATASGSKILHTSPGRIEAFEFALPPLPTQKAIAHILGTLDDRIELNRRMNQTLEAMAQTLFKSWFVDFDPVHAKYAGRKPEGMSAETAALFPDSFQDSAHGRIPRGWAVTKLKDLTSKIGSGATPRGGSAVYVEQGIALIRSQNVYDNEFRWEGLARLSDASAADLSNVEVKLGDVLFNITGDSILRTCVVDPSVLPARVNQHVAIIRAANGVPPRFLHLCMAQPRIKELLLGLNAGATRPAVTKGHLESVTVLHPPVRILGAFDKLTTPLFQGIDTNLQESRTLAAVRDTLLPKLLSGELGVAKIQSALDCL